MRNKQSKRIHEYIDVDKNIHRCKENDVLGKGGQGIVYRTTDKNLAIKLVTDNSGTSITEKKDIDKYRQRFAQLYYLPIPKNINISTPIALLDTQAGYVMRLLGDMHAFDDFLNYKSSLENMQIADIPQWLINPKDPIIDNKTIPRQTKQLVHYRDTGSMKKRLYALYKCSTLLARLHGNGLIYGDISPNNVFMSKNNDNVKQTDSLEANTSVWLIDADNISYEDDVVGNIVYTPEYGAPELVGNTASNSFASDCYAFATMAFKLLSLIHPFDGELLNDVEDDWGSDDDSSDSRTMEEKSSLGLLPWVDDLYDTSNASNQGLPRSLILRDKLKKIFAQTFEQGRLSPWLRPSMYYWSEALARAYDLTILCVSCDMSYYADFMHPQNQDFICPFCQSKRPTVFTMKAYHWQGTDYEYNSPCWEYATEYIGGKQLNIPNRVISEFDIQHGDNTELSITINDEGFLIDRNLHSSKITLDIAESMATESHHFKQLYSKFMINGHSFWLFSKNENTGYARIIFCERETGGNICS